MSAIASRPSTTSEADGGRIVNSVHSPASTKPRESVGMPSRSPQVVEREHSATPEDGGVTQPNTEVAPMTLPSPRASIRGRHRVRWSKADEAFEMQCDGCLQWLPITAEWWVPKHGFGRCRGCYHDAYNGAQQRRNRERRADPRYRLIEAEALRIKRHANRDQVLEDRRSYYRANRAHILARRRELYALRAA